MKVNKDTINRLREICDESEEEKGGYITEDGFVHEVKNVHPQKDNNFMFSCEDLEKLEEENVLATFHTHPNKTSNLSKEDYDAFVNWEKLLHFIIGKDTISCYKVSERGTVVIEPITEVANVC
jgi:proteasome lid subunit RPN8/RPN11